MLANRAGLTLSDDQAALMSAYLDALLDANTRMNLTRISDRAAAEVGHIADALTLLPHLPSKAHRLADVGSGGGVPGIPIAIARPDVQVTLIEATLKKAAFLKETVARLQLKNVLVASVRAEDLIRRGQRFEIVVARAVALMDKLVPWCLPLVKTRGKLLAMKGPRIAEELPLAAKLIKRLGGAEAVVHPVDLPGATGHVIVEVVKKR